MITPIKNVPKIRFIKKIWDEAPHNALTDLIRFRGKWYCCFREGEKHVGGQDGIVRIISSDDCFEWSSIAKLALDGIDLRDPKLSIMPDNRLMLLVGGSVYSPDGNYITRQPRVAFSSDAREWTPFTTIMAPHDWLWRLTWYQGVGYGVSYTYSNPKNLKDEWIINLYETKNGLDYTLVTQWDIPGYPNEATIQFLENGEMAALVRRDLCGDNHAWIGMSFPPYTDWNWFESAHYVGGPNFLIQEGGTGWVAGRFIMPTPWGTFEKLGLGTIGPNYLLPNIFLPSFGDCGYPGMVIHNGHLWMSYYSSHEGKASIYLTKVQF